MFEAAVRLYRRINPPPVPERSLPLRVSVMAAVLIGTLSVLAQGYFSTAFGVLIIGGVIAGNLVSWLLLGRDSWWIKLILSLCLPIVLAYYLVEVVATPFDARVPLARLFLLVQVLHSVDVPARKDLYFSLVSAYTLLAVGGLLSVDSSFGVYVALFVLVSAASLYFGHLSELGVKPRQVLPDRQAAGALGKVSAFGLLATGVLAATIFIFLPRLPGMQLQGLPFSLPRPAIPGFSGEVVNEDYPSWMAGPGRYKFVPSSYYGFAPFVDLRLRGRLSEDLVMKVRASEPLLYRGLAFDRYTGTGWTMSDTRSSRLRVSRQPLFLPTEPNLGVLRAGRQVIQSFFITADQPNVLFAAMAPARLYFPGNSVWQDSYSSIRSPFLLTKGMVYTVVSEVTTGKESQLLLTSQEYPPTVTGRYLELPPIPERVARLSRRLTAGQPTELQKVLAILRFLHNDYRYDLGIAPQKGKGDPVDYFLFVEKRGYCEQFASAFVVLCRASGIPARLVTGFGTGEYNPFTGLYEVREADAHAWAEVYYPVYGWITYEPTPGFTVPTGPQGPWAGQAIVKYLSGVISRGAPGLVGWWKATTASVAGAARDLAGAASSVGRAVTPAGLPVVGLLLVVAVLAAWWIVKRPRLTGQRDVRERGPAAEAFDELSKLLEPIGLVRRPSQTPREFARLVQGRLGRSDVTVVTELFEAEHYGHRRLQSGDLARLQESLRTFSEAAGG